MNEGILDKKESLKKEVMALYDRGSKLAKDFQDNSGVNFRFEYQSWYTLTLKVVDILAPDRYREFRSYYEIDPKRKSLGYGTYTIQDYIKGVAPSKSIHPNFKPQEQTYKAFVNQLAILNSLLNRIDSRLSNIEEELYFDLQNAELSTARGLLRVNIRAAGVLAGIMIETYLQKVAKHHELSIRKKNPTISELNDLLKNSSIIEMPTWRKITYLSDIRNLCAHKKETEPSKEQVEELIEGANWLIKNVY